MTCNQWSFPGGPACTPLAHPAWHQSRSLTNWNSWSRWRIRNPWIHIIWPQTRSSCPERPKRTEVIQRPSSYWLLTISSPKSSGKFQETDTSQSQELWTLLDCIDRTLLAFPGGPGARHRLSVNTRGGEISLNTQATNYQVSCLGDT